MEDLVTAVIAKVFNTQFFEVALVSSPILYSNCYQKSKQTSIRKKFVILQSIGIIAIKIRETRAVIYTCRYSSKHF